MNKSDSERIASALKDIGYKPASKIDEADLAVIVMCSVRQSAVDRVYGKISKFLNIKKKNPKFKTLLTGCILKNDFRKLKEHFDYILPIKTLNQWKDFLKEEKYFDYRDQRNPEFCKNLRGDYFKIRPSYSNSFSALVPISTGCNNFCAFCVVPHTRGPEVHRNYKEIIKEIENLVQKGIKEIWLLGQNVNSYKSKDINFPKLLKLVNNIKGNFWIRFTSSHPKDFSIELIEAMKDCKKVTEYLNLPVQSGNNKILKEMNRPYTVEKYKEMIKKVKQEIPNICLSTDVIVGFPGETEKQFQDTAKLFKEVGFDMAYISQYSQRIKPKLKKLEDNISHQEKERRKKVLTEVLKQTSLKNNEKYIGKTTQALISKKGNAFLLGKTRNYKTVRISGRQELVGEFVKIKITDASCWRLEGRLIKNS